VRHNDVAQAEQQREAARWRQDRLLYTHHSTDCGKCVSTSIICRYFVIIIYYVYVCLCGARACMLLTSGETARTIGTKLGT